MHTAGSGCFEPVLSSWWRSNLAPDLSDWQGSYSWVRTRHTPALARTKCDDRMITGFLGFSSVLLRAPALAVSNPLHQVLPLRYIIGCSSVAYPPPSSRLQYRSYRFRRRINVIIWKARWLNCDESVVYDDGANQPLYLAMHGILCCGPPCARRKRYPGHRSIGVRVLRSVR